MALKPLLLINASFNIYVDSVDSDVADVGAGVYVFTQNGTQVVRIGATSGGAELIKSPLAGSYCGPLFANGIAFSQNQVTKDFQIGQAALANVLGL